MSQRKPQSILDHHRRMEQARAREEVRTFFEAVGMVAALVAVACIPAGLWVLFNGVGTLASR